MILSYALMQFSKVSAYFYAIQESHQSMDKVLLQNTFQSSVPPINAIFGLFMQKKFSLMRSSVLFITFLFAILCRLFGRAEGFL